jgi:hypothetical protein
MGGRRLKFPVYNLNRCFSIFSTIRHFKTELSISGPNRWLLLQIYDVNRKTVFVLSCEIRRTLRMEAVHTSYTFHSFILLYYTFHFTEINVLRKRRKWLENTIKDGWSEETSEQVPVAGTCEYSDPLKGGGNFIRVEGTTRLLPGGGLCSTQFTRLLPGGGLCSTQFDG